jgi:anti-anti-sigma regulatory factor
MNISEENLQGSITKINLSGRMDIEGVSQIEIKFAGMCAAPRIRALLINAKAVRQRGGKFVLLNPDTKVKKVLVSSSIDQLITICDDLSQALVKVTS